MSNAIVNFIIGLFPNASGVFIKELIVFIISLLPILELRGGLLAASLLKLDPWASYIICMIGNLLPIPFILLLINKIIEWMRKKKRLKNVVNFIDKKVTKNKAQIEKYGYVGLALFVGIPLPGTGAWTGALLASVLEMDRKKSFLAIVIGVFIASVIMMLISFGILGNIIK